MDSEVKLNRRILLVENDSALRKILTQNLELYTGSQIIPIRDADALIDHLKREEEDPDLIISENMVGDEYTILKIFYYVNSQKLGIPIILLGENPKVKEQVTQIQRSDWALAVKTAAKLMNVTAQEMSEFEVPTYYPVPVGALLGLKSAPTDLFLRNDDNYQCWFGAGGEISEKGVSEKILDGCKLVFVRSVDRLAFAKGMTEHLQTLLKSESDVGTRVSITGQSFNSVAELLKNTGFNAESIALAKVTIDSVEQIASSSPKLEELMAILMRDESSIAWRHCVMTSVVAHAMLGKIDWGTKEQRAKVVFAAFFHDICIPEDKYAAIHNGGELMQAGFKPEEVVKVERHAYAACELIQGYPDVPFGSESIILQHHGMPNGIGFPQDHLDNRITPLAIVFRIAEDYVHQMLDAEKPDTFFILKSMASRYTKGHYQKALEALRACHPSLHS